MRTYLTITKFLFIVFSWILIGNVYGVEVRDLDDASIKVESRAKAERTNALKQALSQVLVKNTGSAQVLSHELVKAKLANPASMLSRYRYLENQDGLWLEASFDHQRLLGLLRQTQAPIWGNQRPLTLLWLVNETELDRQIIGDATISPVRERIVQDSSALALPILLPLLDLDDVMSVGVADVRGGFIQVVGNASARYNAEFFAMASLVHDALQQKVSYRLALYDQGEFDPFSAPLLELNSEAEDQDTALAIMASELAHFYSSRYGVSDSGQELASQVAFDDIDMLAQLVGIEKYLMQLTAVKGVQLSEIQGKRVVFDIELFGSEEDLLKQLSLAPNIQAKEAESYDGEQFSDEKQIATFLWLANQG